MKDLPKFNRYLVCLSPQAEEHLQYISERMQMNHSMTIRQALGFLARHVAEAQQAAAQVQQAAEQAASEEPCANTPSLP